MRYEVLRYAQETGQWSLRYFWSLTAAQRFVDSHPFKHQLVIVERK